MSKYIDADKFYAKVVSGEPFLFDHAIEHEIKFMLEQESRAEVIETDIVKNAIENMSRLRNTYQNTEYENVITACMGELLNALKESMAGEMKE